MLSGFFVTGLGIVVTALKYPLYLHFLGYEVYGAWLMLVTLISMAQFGMLGIGPAITKLVSEELGNCDYDAIGKYISTAIVTLFVSGLAIISLILFFQSTVLRLLGFEGSSLAIGEEYIFYICALTLYVFLYQGINATIAGLGRMDISNYSKLAVQLVPLLISIPMLMLGKGVLSLLIGNAFAYFVVSIANVIFILKCSEVRPSMFFSVSLVHSKKLIKFGVPVLGSSITTILFLPITKIFISNYVGLSFVPIYEVASRAAIQVQGLFSMGFKSLLPEFSKLHAESTCHSYEKFKKIQRKAFLISIIGGLLVCVCVFTFCPLIFRFWLGGEYRPEMSTVTRIMLVGVFLSITTLVPYNNLLALRETTKFFIYHLVFSTINTLALVVIFIILGFQSVVWAAFANTIGWFFGWCYLFPQDYIRQRNMKQARLL